MVLTLKPDFDVDVENGGINLPSVERLSDSPFVEKVWYSRSERGGSFISTAETHCEIVVTSYQDRTVLTVRGPETRPTTAYCPPNTEFMGIVFKVGAFMPRFPASMLMDRQDIDLPQAGTRSFWLDSSAWEYPNYDNADTFINRLMRKGLLVNDEVIDLTLRDQSSFIDRSRRTIQRRFLQATGLTYTSVFQIQRVRYATSLLKQGLSILDTVEQAGYTDQAHMTHALRQFMGFTPGRIMTGNTDKPMSLLYKTAPF